MQDGQSLPDIQHEAPQDCAPVCVHPFKFSNPSLAEPKTASTGKHRHESQLHDFVDSLEDRRQDMQKRLQESRVRFAATMVRLQEMQFGRDERMVGMQERLNTRNKDAVVSISKMMNRWL